MLAFIPLTLELAVEFSSTGAPLWTGLKDFFKNLKKIWLL